MATASKLCFAAWCCVFAGHWSQAIAALTTVYAYDFDDGQGHITQRGFDAHTISLYGTTGTLMSETSTVYDRFGRRITVIQSAGGSGPNLMTRSVYDAAGNVLTKYVADMMTSYTYDSLGRQVTVAGPAGALPDTSAALTEYVYDAGGNVLTQRVRLTSAGANAETVSHYDVANRATKVADPEGHYRTYWFDSVGNVVRSYAFSSSNVALEQNRSFYDSAGRVIQQARMGSPGSTATTPDVAIDDVVDYAYDLEGRVTTETRYGNGNPPQPLVKYSSYDGFGRLTRAEDPKHFLDITEYDNRGFATAQIRYDGTNHRSESVYDNQGRMLTSRAMGPPVIETKYVYDERGLRISTLTPSSGADALTTVSYDLMGRKRFVAEAVGTADERVTEYTYSDRGVLTMQVAYNGVLDSQTTKYQYSAAGKLTRVVYPDLGPIQFWYYPNGAVSQRIDQAGITLQYVYDTRGLLLTKGTPDGTYWLTYNYDPLGRMLSAKKGTNADDDAESQTTYTYEDARGPVSESQTISGGTARTAESTYDRSGKRTRLEYPQ